MKHSIKGKLLKAFLLALGALLIVSFTFSQISMNSLRNKAESVSRATGSQAAQNSEVMLVDQALSSVERFVTEKADGIDNQIEGFVRSVRQLAAYTGYLYEHPQAFIPQKILSPRQMVEAGMEMTGNTLHWMPEEMSMWDDPAVLAEASLMGNLEPMFQAVMSGTPEFSSLYIATESGVNIGYDDAAAAKASVDSFDATGLEWYRSVRETGELFVSETYSDSFGRGLCVTVSTPITQNGAFVGVLGVDLLIENINKNVLNTEFGAGTYAMLAAADGELISMQGLTDAQTTLASVLGSEGENAQKAMLENSEGHIQTAIDGDDVYVVYAPVETIGWKLAVIMPVGNIVEPAVRSNAAITAIIEDSVVDMSRYVRNVNLLLIALYLFIGIALILVVRRICDRISKPIIHLTGQVEEIGEGNLNYVSDIQTGDEVELLSKGFESMTLSLKDYIGNLTAVTAEKERIGAELSVATQIQASMLPCIFPPYPERSEFSIYATMNPAKEVGGDFYDFFLIDEDHLAVVIADVSGKGVPAALFMVIAKTLIKNHAQAGMTPAEVFTNANGQLCENNEAGMFVTGWMGVLTISTGDFVFVNAGHNPPLVKRANGAYEYLKLRPGFVLAGMEGIRYRQSEMKLEPGDALFLYTDGVTEATDAKNELYGEDRLLTALNAHEGDTPETLLPDIKADIDAFVKEAPQFDDITMLSLQIHGKG